MKKLFLLLAILFSITVKAQPPYIQHFPHGNQFSIDSFKGSLEIDHNFILAAFATHDTTLVLGFDSTGRAVLRKMSISALVDSTIYATINYVNRQGYVHFSDSNRNGGYLAYYKYKADSAAVWGNFSLYLRYQDTANMLAPYARLADMLNSLALKTNVADSNKLGAYLSYYRWVMDSTILAVGKMNTADSNKLGYYLSYFKYKLDSAATALVNAQKMNVSDSNKLGFYVSFYKYKVDSTTTQILIGTKLNIADSNKLGYYLSYFKYRNDSIANASILTTKVNKVDSNINGGYASFFMVQNLPAYGISSTNIAHWNIAYNKYIYAVAFNPNTGDDTLKANDGTLFLNNLDGRWLLISKYKTDSTTFASGIASKINIADSNKFGSYISYNRFLLDSSIFMTALADTAAIKVSLAKHTVDSAAFMVALADSAVLKVPLVKYRTDSVKYLLNGGNTLGATVTAGSTDSDVIITTKKGTIVHYFTNGAISVGTPRQFYPNVMTIEKFLAIGDSAHGNVVIGKYNDNVMGNLTSGQQNAGIGNNNGGNLTDGSFNSWVGTNIMTTCKHCSANAFMGLNTGGNDTAAGQNANVGYRSFPVAYTMTNTASLGANAGDGKYNVANGLYLGSGSGQGNGAANIVRTVTGQMFLGYQIGTQDSTDYACGWGYNATNNFGNGYIMYGNMGASRPWLWWYADDTFKYRTDFQQRIYIGDTVMGHPKANSVTTDSVLSYHPACNCWLLEPNGAGGGGGTVNSFSAGNLSPLFTTSVATATTTPALTFTLSNAAANTIFGNNTGVSAAPTFFSPVLASALFANQGTTSTVLHGNAAGNPSFGQVNLASEVTGLLPLANITPGTSAQILINNATPSAAWVTLSGDATISNTGVVTLKNTGTAGTYGDATHVPQITFDAQGRETAVTLVAITGGGGMTIPGSSTEFQYRVNATTLGAATNFILNSTTSEPELKSASGYKASTDAGFSQVYSYNALGQDWLAVSPSVGNPFLLQKDLVSARIGLFNGFQQVFYGDMAAITVSGTSANQFIAYNASNNLPNNNSLKITTASTAGSAAGVYGTWPTFVMGNDTLGGGVELDYTFGFTTYASTDRIMIGATSSYGGLLTAGSDPSTYTNMFGVSKDVADATLQYVVNGASGTATKTSTGITPNTTDVFILRIYVPSNSTRIYMQLEDHTKRTMGTPTPVEYIGAKVPAAGTAMAPVAQIGNGTVAAARAMNIILIKQAIEQ